MGKYLFIFGLIILLSPMVIPTKNSVQSQSREFELDAIRFFEAGSESPPISEHNNATQFPKSTTRYVYCKVHFKNLLYKVREHTHNVTWRYFDPHGNLFGEVTDKLTMKYEWESPAIWRAFGWKEPGKFTPGTYQVHISVDGRKIGQDQFTIMDDANLVEARQIWDQYNRGLDETSSPAQSSEQLKFQFERASTGIGGILQTQTTTTESAETLLATAFREARPHFKAGPFGVSGFSDVSGQETQIFFQANYQGNPVVGLATAVVNSQTRHVVIKFIFNQPGQINTILKNMARQAGVTGGRTGKNPVTSLQWSWQESREGASRLKLPAGWQIMDSNAQGMLYARGSHGSVTFGLYFTIYTPTYMFAAIDQRIVVAAYCDPVTAFQNVLPKAIQKYLYQMQGKSAPQFNSQIIESTPVTGFQGSQAAMIHFDVQIMQANGTREHNRGLATVLTAPTGSDQWLLYYSEISSPANSYNANLPVLWEIWKSWETSNKVLQQRIDNTIKSLNEANKIIQEGVQARNRVMEDSFSDWSEYVRGYRHIEDTNNNDLYQVNLHLAQPLVEKLNDNLGHQRYREVPMREFNRRY